MPNFSGSTTLSLLLLISLVTCSLCAPLVTRDCGSNGTPTTTPPPCQGKDKKPWSVEDTLTVILLGLIALGIAGSYYCGARRKMRIKTPSHAYPAVPNATAEKVYDQLRRKWKAHEEEMNTGLRSTAVTVEMLADQSTMNRMKKAVDDVKYYNAQCKRYFDAKKYPTAKIPLDDSVNLAVLFEKECAILEAFVKKVGEMKKMVPRSDSGFQTVVVSA